MFKTKDKCYKVHKITHRIECVNNEPKVYTVMSTDTNGLVLLYNNLNVVFDNSGNVINAPPSYGKNASNWWDHKLVKIEDYYANN